MRLVIQFKTRNSYSFLSYCQRLLCCGGHSSSVAFIDAKTKYRSPYLLNVSQPYLQSHIRTSLGRPRVSKVRPQDVGSTHPLELQIKPYWDVLVTSALEVLKTSAGDVPWRYIQDIMGTSSGRHISTSKGCRQKTSSRRSKRTFLGVTQRTICGHPKDVFWELPQDILGT